MKSVCQSEMSVIQIMNKDIKEEENGRVFNYALNKKRAKSKLLKGAKRTNLDVELKPGCVNLIFCGGAFCEIVLPLIRYWNTKVNETVTINETEIKIMEVHTGVETSEHHIDTKLVLNVNGDRLVLHAYNGTQKLMVQGKNYENFALNCLQPYFFQEIEKSTEKIQKFNNVVKDTLDISKPVKIKTDKPYKCAQCEVKPTTIGDLRLHMKKCHTKPSLNSPKRTKALKTGKEDNKSIPFDIPKKDKEIIDTKAIKLYMPEVEELLNCNICDFDTDTQEVLTKHTEILHEQKSEPIRSDYGEVRSILNLKTDSQEAVIDVNISEKDNSLVESSIICGECGKSFIEASQYTDHMGTHVTSLEVNCQKCDFITMNKDEIKEHIQTIHSEIKVNLKIEDQNVISCDECDYKCRLNIQLKKHMKNKHEDDRKYKCTECEYTTNFIGKSWEHTMNVHIDASPEFTPDQKENFMLNIVAEQTTTIYEEIGNIRKETKDTLNEFAKILEVCIEKLNDNTNDKCKALGNTIDKLCDKVTKLEESLNKDMNTNEKLNKVQVEEKKASKHKDVKKMTYASVVSASPEIRETTFTSPPSFTASQQQSRSKFLSQPKLLFAGDSVANSANLRKLEKSHKLRIRSVRAYSSVYDKLAKFPSKNFKAVVADNLENPGRENYDILVMSSPTVDITNVDTAKYSMDRMEEMAEQSSKNMINIAEQSLAKNESLKQVIIMEHPPRFDGRKSQLVRIANDALKQFRLNSPSRDRIVIGQHSLESSGGGYPHQARYEDYHTGRYDGVHMYGRTGTRDYTNSMDTMLLMALSETRAELTGTVGDHTDCEQAQFQWRQAREKTNRQTVYYRYGHQYNSSVSVPTQNRFNLFNQGN